MPDPTHRLDLPVSTMQHTEFALPCTVLSACRYLSDPAIVLGAVPGIARVVQRHSGAFRLTLTPIQIPGHAIRPAAEVRIRTSANGVIIRSIPEAPYNLGADEIATIITGLFDLAPTTAGCTVRATLRLDAAIPGHLLPPHTPRAIARQMAELLLMHRMKHEIQTTARALIAGYSAWNEEVETEAEKPHDCTGDIARQSHDIRQAICENGS